MNDKSKLPVPSVERAFLKLAALAAAETDSRAHTTIKPSALASNVGLTERADFRLG